MAHDFYCTHCGTQVKTDTVLFDLGDVIAGDGERMHILKFRMTELELRDLARWGSEVEPGKYQCTLFLENLMYFIGNRNNLDLPDAERLTMEELVEFINTPDPEPAQWGVVDDSDLFDGLADDPEEPAEPELPRRVWSPVLEAMIRKDLGADSVFAEQRLRHDLTHLHGFLWSGGSLRLQFCTEQDDRGDPVTVGVVVTRPSGRRFNLEKRVCPVCGERLPEHAFTAPHRIVTLLGFTEGLAEDLLTALTHYGINHLRRDTGSEIWRDAETIPSVECIKLLAQHRMLTKSLQYYSRGIQFRMLSQNNGNESFARCVLFANPGKYDRMDLINLNRTAGAMIDRIFRKRDTNSD